MKNIKSATSLVISALMLNIPVNMAYAQNPPPVTNDMACSIRPLPGGLNQVPVANSNSPEVIKTEGILLSTFPPDGKATPEAHLNHAFNGKFDIFTHHIAVEREPGQVFDVYQGIILHNPAARPVSITVHSAATYRSQPDAAFIKLNDFIENPEAKIFAGPGDRVNQDIIRGKNNFLKNKLTIPAGGYLELFNDTIPIETLTPPINGRSLLFKLESDGPVYFADLATYKVKPTLKDWLKILNNGKLAEKRDSVPTPLGQPGGQFLYGRVSGVAIGNEWKGTLTNGRDNNFEINSNSLCTAFALNTVYNNTWGTGQVQSAEMVKRYPDTAYQAHANYAVSYNLNIPLHNTLSTPVTVQLSFDSPIRIPEGKPQDKISFNETPPERINFRGEFKLTYESFFGQPKEEYFHVVQRFGQKGQPLLNLLMLPGDKRNINVSYIYPADATPPHVLTISTKK